MKEYIQAAPAFAGVSTAGIDLLATAGTWVSLTAGETLFHIHDKSRTLYLVAEGHLDVLAPDSAGTETVVVGQLGPGDIAGEIQMLTGGRRSATVRAHTAARAIRFSRETFERLAETEPAFLEHIRALALARLRRNHLASILPARFGPLDFHQMEEIESLGRWMALHKGEVLFRQGDAGDGAYILVTGRLGVLLRNPDGSSRLVNHIQHGEIVGEIALVSDEPRPATVYATRESDLLFFGKREVAKLIGKHSIAQAGPQSDTSVTAVVAASPAVPLAEFSSRLTQHLAEYCRVLHANRKRLQEHLGAPDDSAAAREILVTTRFPAWLCSEEGKHRIILLETDYHDPDWTEACIRRADQALTVALAGDSPALSEIEAWLENRRVETHHHVRLGNDGDFKRLARFLTGSEIDIAGGTNTPN